MGPAQYHSRMAGVVAIASDAEAHALYRALGFRGIAPHTDIPARIRPHMLFMELTL